MALVDRMTALDAEFLHLEDGVNHMHIAACAVFEGPAPAPAEWRALVAAALPEIPRYRQRVRFVPLQLGRPVWVDDDAFDLDHHLMHAHLTAPGGDDELEALMADVMGSELDRRHPLWELWVVDGLSGDRWALLAKVHHCMVDGIAGVELMQALLDTAPEPRPRRPDDWHPAPAPTDTELVLGAMGELGGAVVDTGRRLAGALGRPVEALDTARTLATGVGSWLGAAWPTPPTSIDGSIGERRRWTTVRVALDDARRIKDERGGTVNDVVLAAITRGFRDLLIARGEDPRTSEVRTLVPVSVRTEHGVLDNEVSALVAELPVADEFCELRYEAVRNELRYLKASHEAEAGEAVTTLAQLVPPPLMALGTRAVVAWIRRFPQRNVSTVCTNVPGPQFPLYAAGRRMLDYFPFVPVALGVRFAVAILSYDGNLCFGITADHDSAPDIGVLAAGIQVGFDELLAGVGHP